MDGEIDPNELADVLGDDGPLVVDIRQPPSFARGRIPDSVNVPLPQLPQDVDRIADADHVVTVCPHGKASVRAARLVTAFEGFDGRVESLRGGLEAWEGPLERDEGDTDMPADDRVERSSSDAPF